MTVSRRLTRGEKVIAFIHKYCRVPEGKLVGQPMKLAKFQKKFILAIYDNPEKTYRAILSIGRKNGKTALIAALLLAHIAGPEAKRNAQLVSGAKSREQASLIFKLACKMIDLSPELRMACHYIPSRKIIQGRIAGTEYTALSAEATTAHGLSPVFAVLDELGQVKGSSDPFIDAITSSQGAHDDPLTVVISTQAPSDADLLSIWIDDAVRSGDPHVVCHVYAADEGCDLDDEAQWKKANPGLGLFRSLDDVRTQAGAASRLPTAEASFRNLILNQRVAQESLWIAPGTWKECNLPVRLEVFQNNSVCIGLDLSARRDLTAAVLAAKAEDGIHLLPFVFTPMSGLKERSLIDKAPYDAWVNMGLMYATPGGTVDYGWVVKFLHKWCEDNDVAISMVAFDRWRIDTLKKAAEEEGFAPFAEWVSVGQGYRGFSPRVESFEAALLQNMIRHDGHPLLNLAASHAIMVKDPAGNKKLDKTKTTQRIDPLVAAVMAVHEVTEGTLDGGVDVDMMILV